MVGCRIVEGGLKKRSLSGGNHDWLNSLLSSEFFDSCEEHSNLRKNEKNMFCIDCNLSLCKHCINSSSSHHRLHKLLQICKYVYHNVVRLHDIQKYLHCSFIQTYKINGEKAVHLNPRPQITDNTKASKCKGGGAFCESCQKHIQDLPNRFCSISCKLAVSSIDTDIYKISIPVPECNEISINGGSSSDQGNNSIHTNQDESSTCTISEESCDVMSQQRLLNPNKRRKGVPRRAPLH